MLRSLTIAGIAGVLLSGCATFPQDQAVPHGLAGPRSKAAAAMSNPGPTCADATYSATMANGAEAKSVAETALLAQLKDARGDMLMAGFRKLHYELQPTRCEATITFGGEVHCKATASVCGH